MNPLYDGGFCKGNYAANVNRNMPQSIHQPVQKQCKISQTNYINCMSLCFILTYIIQSGINNITQY